jgi:hypothetical protein
MMRTEEIVHSEIDGGEGLLALIVYAGNQQFDPGLQFLTKPEDSLQLACMRHEKGKTIDAHRHPIVSRKVSGTHEVLLVRSGKVRVDFYSSRKQPAGSRVLVTGDIVLLVGGGHGFEMLEDTEMVEVKQGPYAGEHDKVRF